MPRTESLSCGLDPDLVIFQLFRDRDWSHKTGIGGVLNASSILLVLINPQLIPACFCLWALTTGYVLRTLRVKINDPRARLPAWNNWADLFISGMSWLAIVTGFFLFTVSVALISLSVGTIFEATKAVSSSFIAWAGCTIIGIMLLSMWFNLFTAILMANFAEKESMAAGFSYGKILSRLSAQPGDFLCAWLLSAGIQMLAILVPTMTVIGIFFLPTTIFASHLMGACLIAQAWSSAGPPRSQAEEAPKDRQQLESTETGSEDSQRNTENATTSDADTEPGELQERD